MKKILKAVASTLMTGISAFVISGMTGSTCVFLLHQPELPEQLDQLRYLLVLLCNVNYSFFAV